MPTIASSLSSSSDNEYRTVKSRAATSTRASSARERTATALSSPSSSSSSCSSSFSSSSPSLLPVQPAEGLLQQSLPPPHTSSIGCAQEDKEKVEGEKEEEVIIASSTATMTRISPHATTASARTAASDTTTNTATTDTPLVLTTSLTASTTSPLPLPVTTSVTMHTNNTIKTTTMPSKCCVSASVVGVKSTCFKKKKRVSPCNAATAAQHNNSANGSGDCCGVQDKNENVGRWTAEEHRMFLHGLELHGKGWKKIASLIKSRSVVQIRTHAQKYFQKLAKARQNGEEGDVAMEGRGGGGASSVASLSSTMDAAAHAHKRRIRHSASSSSAHLLAGTGKGTKRKSIQYIVSSAIRQGKRITAAAAAADNGTLRMPPLPALAPILAHFVPPPILSPKCVQQPTALIVGTTPFPDCVGGCGGGRSSSQGIWSGPVLEDSIFRFLSPMPPRPIVKPQPRGHHSENSVRQDEYSACAWTMKLSSAPHHHHSSYYSAGYGGELTPTGVMDFNLYPSWTDAKDTPSWYARGADVDELLEVGEALDWLADSGDIHEKYHLPPDIVGSESYLSSVTRLYANSSSSNNNSSNYNNNSNMNNDLPEIDDSANDTMRSMEIGESTVVHASSNAVLPRINSNVFPSLSSLLDESDRHQHDTTASLVQKPEHELQHDDFHPFLVTSASDIQLEKVSSCAATTAAGAAAALPLGADNQQLHVFENLMDEQEFVSTLLETE